jgi:putative DNA primase/helicase
VDFVAIAAVVAMAAVVGRRVAIRPKQHDDWTVVPNVWGVAIGRPGVMKSPALREALRPLQRFVVEARKDHKTKILEHEFNQTKTRI